MSGEVPFVFPDDSDIGFDFMMSLFWFLSRAEEYNIVNKDHHDRFCAASSIHSVFSTWENPLVDMYCDVLLKKLNEIFHLDLKRKKQIQRFSIGVDIDRWFKYRHKGLLINTAAILRDFVQFEWKKSMTRLKVMLNLKLDPYDSFSRIHSLGLDKQQIFFFILSGGDSKYDRNFPVDTSFVRQKIHDIQPWAQIALHPSYHANTNKVLFTKEKKELERASRQNIESSRQHFIRLEIPTSYSILREFGIIKDYSMGFADSLGFRAGTCHPFFWYDCEKEAITSLEIIPFVVMDRTLQQYKAWNPQQSVEKCKDLYKRVQYYEGHFHLIWHNSSFDFEEEWMGWEGFLEELIEFIHAK
jgi:hypothetical protein